MVKLKTALLVFSAFIFINLQAQPRKIPAQPAQNIIRDTFAFYLLSTIDKVLRVAEDPAKHPMLLAGEHLKTERTGQGVYRSTIIMPGSLRSEFKFFRTNRKEGTSNWQWVVTIADTPKGKDPALSSLVQKIDTLISSFNDRKKLPGAQYNIYSNAYINTSWNDRDQVFVTVSFNKKIYNTEQAAIDSLIRLYKPLLSDKRTAKECAEKFAYAVTIEGFENSKSSQLFGDIAKELANRDIDAAFQMMMGAPFFVDLKKIKSELTSAQQEQVTKMGQKVIDDYNAEFKNRPRKDVVVEKKKEIEKENPPTDPCERKIWELNIKPGYYVQGNGHIAYVRDYSCQANTYSIAYQNPQQHNKLTIRTGVTIAEMKAYIPTSAAPFIICSHCKGAGHSMEYDWYQMGVGSNFYARSNELRKYTCGVCKGSGYLQVR